MFRLAGFIRRVKGSASTPGSVWDHLYDVSYFFGFFVSGLLHWGLHVVFPAGNERGRSEFEMKLHSEGDEDEGGRSFESEGSREVEAKEAKGQVA